MLTSKPDLPRWVAGVVDLGMCGIMNLIHCRHRTAPPFVEELEKYLQECESLTREEYFRPEEVIGFTETPFSWEWQSPRSCPHPENNRARFLVFPGDSGPSAPCVILLHALMSASDAGYRRMAARFNSCGWNVIFPHLPYHYSRTPRGSFNGELSITPDLIRNAEALRQAVVEIRQAMAVLRARGCTEFGLVGTSYGGWAGALVSFLEPDFRFLALVQPIVDTESAIWKNPVSRTLRRELRRNGVPANISARHLHLSSPLHGVPLCGGERVILAAGLYDSISPRSHLANLQSRWKGSQLIVVPQGHFGYQAHARILQELDAGGWLKT